MTDMLSAEEAAAAWDALAPQETPAAEAPAAGKPKIYRHYRPLSDAVDRIIVEAQDKDRIYTGQAEFDEQMRGIGHGHLCIVTGYSHSGKTQWVASKVLRHNKKARIAWFTPDEPDTLVAAKITSIESGVAARDLERRIGDGDREAIQLLRSTIEGGFPNLIVFDKPLTPEYMKGALEEARDVWGAKEDLIVVDYVDLVQAGDSVPAKFDFLKAVVGREKTRMIAIHQTSRSAGAEGRKMTISSGNYGGEQHATFMIGVRRKKSALMAEKEELLPKVAKGDEKATERLSAVEYDLAIHQYTITVNLVKNKRPGGGLCDDIDLEIDTDTGQLFDLDEGDLPAQYQQWRSEQQRIHRASRPATHGSGGHTWQQERFYDEESF